MTVVRQLTYHPPQPTPVEMMSFAKLRGLGDCATQRGDFHVLAVVRRGRGRVSIDFSEHQLAGRKVVWIRPGVVHRWDDLGDLAGDLVLFVPTAPITAASRDVATGPGAAPCWVAPDVAWPLITTALGHLRRESGAAQDARTGELLCLLLSALLLRLAPIGPGQTPLTTAEIQQLSLARMLLLDPPIVILDEATAEAGSSGAHTLEKSAQALLTGRTAVVVAHRLTQARACDRIAVLDKGRIVEFGTHNELLDHDGRYAELWTAWSDQPSTRRLLRQTHGGQSH